MTTTTTKHGKGMTLAIHMAACMVQNYVDGNAETKPAWCPMHDITADTVADETREWFEANPRETASPQLRRAAMAACKAAAAHVVTLFDAGNYAAVMSLIGDKGDRLAFEVARMTRNVVAGKANRDDRAGVAQAPQTPVDAAAQAVSDATSEFIVLAEAFAFDPSETNYVAVRDAMEALRRAETDLQRIRG